jgi:hypothetical protein
LSDDAVGFKANLQTFKAASPIYVDVVLNLATARNLGIDIPTTVHARVDNVIE